MRAAYTFQGQLWYANRSQTESPLAAIARSLKRRLGAEVSLTYSDRDTTGSETWTAKWYDAKTEVFGESLVRL